MIGPLLVEPEAEAELIEAVRWYDDQSPGLGGRLLTAVTAAMAQIRRFPETGSSVPSVVGELPARRIAVRGFPFDVIYLIVPEEIRVLAIAHQRRKPGYWTDRLP